MQMIIDVFIALFALAFVLVLFTLGKKLRTGLEESEWYDEDF